MRTMLRCDLACTRVALKGTLFSVLVVAVVICVSSSLYAVIPCVTCGMAVMLLYSLLAFDEQNDWQRYRLTLPISREQTVKGRYVSCLAIVGIALVVGAVLTVLCFAVAYLLRSAGVSNFTENVVLGIDPLGLVLAGAAGAAITIVMMAFTIPVAMKTGLTKAIRILPVIFVLLIIVLVTLGQGLMTQSDATAPFVIWLQSETGMPVVVAGMLVLSMVLYAGSCALAKRFYAKREL